VRHIRLLKKTHMLRCARPILRQRTRRVRLRSSIFAGLASEIFLSSLQPEFINQDAKQIGLTILPDVLARASRLIK
jgi:hypothetical protein